MGLLRFDCGPHLPCGTYQTLASTSKEGSNAPENVPLSKNGRTRATADCLNHYI